MSDKRALFPKMGCIGANFRKIAGFTEAFFILGAVDTTITRANRTRLEHVVSLLDDVRE
jgi:hypothetical protein